MRSYRSLFAPFLGLGVPITIGVAVACGPPDSFENITGGVKDAGALAEAAPPPLVLDPTLAPPRPLTPLAGSFINSLRPRFRWEPTKPETIGAKIIVCVDTKCDPATTKTWTATTRELQAPEDLPPGHYFWKMVAISASGFGKDESPLWPMLVRGGKGDGYPAGQIADINGDGISDLLIAVDITIAASSFHDVYGFLGSSPDDPLALTIDSTEFTSPRDYPVANSADLGIQVVDVNGDGIGDPVFADIGGKDTGITYPNVATLTGTRTTQPVTYLGVPPFIPGLQGVPKICAPGDVDGDGRGDVLVGTKTSALVVFGESDGLSSFVVLTDLTGMPTDPDSGALPPPTTPIPVAGLDVDHNGLTDVALASYFAAEGLFYIQAGQDRTFFDSAPLADAGVVPGPATVIGVGDVDGDGVNDTAFTTLVGAKPSVCIRTDASQGQLVCWTPDAPPAIFATNIVGADLDADGKDELLVANGSGGVDILRLTAPDKIEAEHLAIDYGVSLTVLDPGRPKPAVWAATRADGTSFALFQGKEQKRVITVESLKALNFPITRFQAGIR